MADRKTIQIPVDVQLKIKDQSKAMRGISDEMQDIFANADPGTAFYKSLSKAIVAIEKKLNSADSLLGKEFFSEADLGKTTTLLGGVADILSEISTLAKRTSTIGLGFETDELIQANEALKALQATIRSTKKNTKVGAVSGMLDREEVKRMVASSKDTGFSAGKTFDENQAAMAKSLGKITEEYVRFQQEAAAAAEIAEKAGKAVAASKVELNMAKGELQTRKDLNTNLAKQIADIKVSGQGATKENIAKQYQDVLLKQLTSVDGEKYAPIIAGWLDISEAELIGTATDIARNLEKAINTAMATGPAAKNKLRINAKSVIDGKAAAFQKDRIYGETEQKVAVAAANVDTAEEAAKEAVSNLQAANNTVTQTSNLLATIQSQMAELKKLQAEYNALVDEQHANELNALKTKQQDANYKSREGERIFNKDVKNAQGLAQSGYNYTNQAEINRRIGEEQERLIKEAERESQEFTDNLKQSIRHWMSAQQVINMVKDGIRQAYQDIKGLDTAMTNIAVVTDMSVSDLWGKINDYMSIAQQYGVTTQGVYEVSQLYYQQGLSTNEVMAATTETLKMARIAGMDYADAADAMTVAIRAFKMEMTDAEHVTDVYSKVAAVTASDSEELAIAMSKTASSAESVGSSFENTTAMLAVMIETTRESAQNLGSALKSIISRYGEMKVGLTVDSEGEDIDYNKVDTALKSIGISIKDAQGQFRDFDDVIFELSEKWDSLDKNTQRYIATIMAGNRQQSRFIALVDNWERLDEVANAAQDSEDAGLLQYAKTLDSLDTKLNNIKTSFQQFYMSLINGPVIGAALDFINKLLKGFNKLGNWQAILNIAGLISGIKLLGSTILGGLSNPLSKVYERYQIYFKQITELARTSGREAGRAHAQGMQEGQNEQLNGQPQGTQNPSRNTPAAPTNLASKTSWFGSNANKWGTTKGGRNVGSIVSLVSSIFGVAGSAAGTALTANGHRGWGAAASLAGNAASGAAMGASFGPWGALIGGLAGVASGIPNLVKALDKNTQRAKETEKAREKAEKKNIERAEAKEEYNQLKDLIAKVEDTEKNKLVDDSSYQEWINANNALVEAYPELLSYIDSEGNAIANLTNKTQLLDDAMTKAAEASIAYYEARKQELQNQIKQSKQYTVNYSGRDQLGYLATENTKTWLADAGIDTSRKINEFNLEQIFGILKHYNYTLQDLMTAAKFYYNDEGKQLGVMDASSVYYNTNKDWYNRNQNLINLAGFLLKSGDFFTDEDDPNLLGFNQEVLNYSNLNKQYNQLIGTAKGAVLQQADLKKDTLGLSNSSLFVEYMRQAIEKENPNLAEEDIYDKITSYTNIQWEEQFSTYQDLVQSYSENQQEIINQIFENSSEYTEQEIRESLEAAGIDNDELVALLSIYSDRQNEQARDRALLSLEDSDFDPDFLQDADTPTLQALAKKNSELQKNIANASENPELWTYAEQAYLNQQEALKILSDILSDEDGMTVADNEFYKKAIELMGTEDSLSQLQELAEQSGIILTQEFITAYENGIWSSFSTYVATYGEDIDALIAEMEEVYSANEKGLTAVQATNFYDKYGKGIDWSDFFTTDDGKLQIRNIEEIFQNKAEEIMQEANNFNANLSTYIKRTAAVEKDESLRTHFGLEEAVTPEDLKLKIPSIEQSLKDKGFSSEQASNAAMWVTQNADKTFEEFLNYLQQQGKQLENIGELYSWYTENQAFANIDEDIQSELNEYIGNKDSLNAIRNARGNFTGSLLQPLIKELIIDGENTIQEAFAWIEEFFTVDEKGNFILTEDAQLGDMIEVFGNDWAQAIWDSFVSSDFDKAVKKDSTIASLPETFSNLIKNAEETTLADIQELYDSIYGEGSFEKIDITEWQEAITAARNGTVDSLIKLILGLAEQAETELETTINTDFSEKYNEAAKSSNLLAAEKALAGSADRVFEESEFEEILKGYNLSVDDYTVDAQGNVTINEEKYEELLQKLPTSLRNEQLALAEKETESAIKAVEDLGSKLASGEAGTQDYMDVFGDQIQYEGFGPALAEMLAEGTGEDAIKSVMKNSGLYQNDDAIDEAYKKLVASYKDSTNANVIRYFELTEKALKGIITNQEQLELDTIEVNEGLKKIQLAANASGREIIIAWTNVIAQALNSELPQEELLSTVTSGYKNALEGLYKEAGKSFEDFSEISAIKSGDGIYDPSELSSSLGQLTTSTGKALDVSELFSFDEKANGLVLNVAKATAWIANSTTDETTRAYLQALVAAENNRQVDALIESHELFSSFEDDLAAVLNDYTNVSLDTLVGMYESIFGEDTIEPKKVEEYRQAIEEAKEGNTTALANHIGALAATANAHGIANVDIDMLAAALEDGTRTLVQTLIDRIKAAIEGAISRTDMLSLGKDLDITNIEDYFIRTSDGYEATQEGMMVLGAKMVEHFDSAYEAAEAMYELFVGEDKLYSGYKELEDSATRLRNEAKNLESTDADRAKILREQADLLDHMADVSRRMADDASFDFMNQDRTDGWGDTWDTYVSNVNQAKDALNSLQAGESIAVRDFQNMMGFMGDQLGFDAEKNGTDVFTSLGLDTTKIKQTMKDIAAATAAANGFKATDPLAFLGQDLASFNSLVEKSNGAELYQLYVDTIVAASGELDSIDADIMLDFGLSMKNTGEAMSDSLAQVAKDQIQFLKGIRNMLVAMKGIDGINAEMGIGLKYTVTGSNGQRTEKEMTLDDVLDLANGTKTAKSFGHTSTEINNVTAQTLTDKLGADLFTGFFGKDGFDYNNTFDKASLEAIVGFNEQFGELTAEQWQTVAQGAAAAVGDLDPVKDSEEYRKAITEYLKNITEKGTVIGTDILELSNIQIGLSSIGIKYNIGDDGKIHLEGDYDEDNVKKALEAQFASQNQSVVVTIDNGVVTVHYVDPTIKAKFGTNKNGETVDPVIDETTKQVWFPSTLTVTNDNGTPTIVDYLVNATDGSIAIKKADGTISTDIDETLSNALQAEFGDSVTVEAGKVQYTVASAEPVDSAALLQTINENLASITSLLNAGTVEINLSVGDDTEETITTLKELNTLITSLQNGDFTAIDSLVLLATALSNANTNLGIVALGNIFSSITANSAALASFDATALVAQLQAFNNLTLDSDVVDQLVTLADLLNAIPDVDIDLSLTEAETTKSDIQDITDLINKVPTSKSFTISANIPQATAISQLAEALQKLKTALLAIGNKTFTITANVNGSINTKYGNANATGNVPIYYDDTKAKGNFSLLALGGALASGTLMGELGPELYVQGGHYYVAGTNGPEFVDLHDDAIVFNHLQTADLLGKGHTSRTGKPRISEERSVAFATGNVSGPAHANSNLDSAIAAIDAAIAMWQNILNATAQNLANGGSGGGGGGGGAQAPTAELQEWYNLSREIARLEQEINNLLAERKNLTDGSEYVRNLRKQQLYLDQQLATQQQLYDYQKKQLDRQKLEINSDKVWSQFLIVDENGNLRYRNGNESDGGKGALDVLANLNKKKLKDQADTIKNTYGYKAYDNTGKNITKDLSDEELVQHFFDSLQAQIDSYDALYDTVQATDQAMAELEAQIAEIEAEILQNTMDLEQAIYDIIVENAEKAIEKLEEYTEKLGEANEAYIDGLKESLDAEKKQYEKEQSDNELSQLQRRLNLLRRTGGSATEIAELEKQLNDSLKEQYFDEQETLIEELEKTSEEQIEKLEQQITIQQETLEFQKEAGLIWNGVSEIMTGTKDQITAWMQSNDSSLRGLSANQLNEALQNTTFQVEMYITDRDETQQYKADMQKHEEAGWDSSSSNSIIGQALQNSEQAQYKKNLYDMADEDTQKSMRSAYEQAYLQARQEGKTDEEAHIAGLEAFEAFMTTYWQTNTEGKKHWGAFLKDHLGKDLNIEIGPDGSMVNFFATHEEDLEKANAKIFQELKEKKYNDKSLVGITNYEQLVEHMKSLEKGTEEYKAAYRLKKAYEKSELKKSQKTMKRLHGKAATVDGTKVGYFKQGGIVDYTGTAVVHGTPSKPEAFLNAKQTAMISDAVRAAGEGNVLDGIRATLANLASYIRSLVTNNITTQSSNITVAPGAVVLNVAKLNDSYDIEELSNDIMNRMVNIASKATNRGVNRR